MKYFAETPAYFPSASNKLYEAVHGVLKEYNRYVFPPKDLPVVQSSLINIINSLSAQYHRCKPLEPTWHDNKKHNVKNDISCHDFNLFLGANTYTCYLTLKLGREAEDL